MREGPGKHRTNMHNPQEMAIRKARPAKRLDRGISMSTEAGATFLFFNGYMLFIPKKLC